MIRTLIVFEFAEEIKAFISQNSPDELRLPDTYILAILPEAQVYLKRRGIPFFDTYSFFDKSGHESALLRSDNIYKFLRQFINIEDDIGIKNGYNISFLLYVRLYVHYILWLTEVLYNACTQLGIKRIICSIRDNAHMPEPFLSNNEGYAGEIVRMISENIGLSFTVFQVRKEGEGLSFHKIKNNFSEVVKLILYHINSVLIKNSSGTKKFILATSESYNLGRVLRHFKDSFGDLYTIYLSVNKKDRLKFNEGKRFIPLPASINRGKRAAFWGRLNSAVSKAESSTEGAEVFTFRGVNFKDIIFGKIKRDIVPAVCNIYGQTVYLDRFLKNNRPAMIISQMGRYTNYNIGELSSLYNIPSLLISHGSHVPPKNEYEMMEWKEHGLGLMNTHYKYIAVQSPWARAYLEKIPTKSEQIITGPLLFAKTAKDNNKRDILRERLVPEHKNKIILLHADTPRQRMAMRLYVYQTVDEYIYNVNSLIKAVEQADAYHLIVRFRPLHYLSREDILPLLIQSDCYSVHSEGVFDDYLSIADMLVSYSSTTIEEALQNRVPVLQYDSQGKYCHIEGQELDPSLNPKVDSCYYINSEDKLLRGLKWLSENHFAKDIHDSLWNRHFFKEEEKIKLPEYFNNLFYK